MGTFFLFLKKAFLWGTNFFGKFMGGCFTWGLRNRSCKEEGEGGSFTNAFSSNLNTVNLRIFCDHGGRHT